jgi:putative SOS response-associated peptidase YedK
MGFTSGKKTDGKKQPFFIRLKGEKPFGIAGPWERWEKGREAG